jgi:hypothetical protein
MVCHECRRETADGFSFCPHCGTALPAWSPVVGSTTPPLEVKAAKEVETGAPAPTSSIASDGRNEIGTYVFGAFALTSLLVSLIKGVVPIYLLESTIWAGAAWYWHRAKTHSELRKAIVVVIAVLVAVGEVIHIASQSDFQSERRPPAIPDYSRTPPTIERPIITADAQAIANIQDPPLKAEPQSRKMTLPGLSATVSCDVVAYDRDKYGDGDPKAIATLHEGDTVPYIGHVTVGDEDIIRVHGRRGYVSGCVDVKMSQELARSALNSEPKPNKAKNVGLEATITCDAIVWDRDKYGDGDPIAIASVHRGDTVPYIGHVTVGDEDIIRVHGRKGYVSGCVDLKQVNDFIGAGSHRGILTR